MGRGFHDKGFDTDLGHKSCKAAVWIENGTQTYLAACQLGSGAAIQGKGGSAGLPAIKTDTQGVLAVHIGHEPASAAEDGVAVKLCGEPALF